MSSINITIDIKLKEENLFGLLELEELRILISLPFSKKISFLVKGATEDHVIHGCSVSYAGIINILKENKNVILIITNYDHWKFFIARQYRLLDMK